MMKTIQRILLLVCFLSFLQSCKKNNEIEITTLVGTWDLIYTRGGILGGGYEANFDRMIVSEDMKFELTQSGSLIANGEVEEVESEEYDYFVLFNKDVVNSTEHMPIIGGVEQIVHFQGDTLKLQTYAFDGFDTYFKKLD